MVVIGVTGNFASGKTLLSSYFRSMGAKVIDVDRVGHAILKNKNIKEKIISIFGEKVLKRTEIERSKLADIVFKSRKNLNILNEMVHPVMVKKMRQSIKQYKKKDIIVIDAALLIEMGLYKDADKVVLVKSNIANQLKRCKRLGVSRSKAIKIIKAQTPLRKKEKYADFIIENNGSKKDFKDKALKIWKKIVL